VIRRNVASQPILLGPLTLKSNGDNVTSGASITVRKDGVTVTAAGTLTHVSNGVWEYVPTQSETDCALLGLILSASNAYAVALTVPTTRLPLQTLGVLPDVAANSAGGLPVLDSNSTIAANVTRFGGVAGTFSGGRPEVNTTHWGGTATSSANVQANVVQIAGQTANASAAVTFPASVGTSTLDATSVWSHTTRTLTSGAAPSVADIWSHTTRTLTGTVNANVIQIAGQTANATTAVTFPASVGTSTLDAAGVWGHTTRTLTSGAAPSVADIWSHTTRTLTSGAAPSVADIWSHTSRTLTGTPAVNVTQWDGTAVDSATVRANVVQIAGQTANASTSVTFPGSVGSSTLVAADVWNYSTRTLTSGAAPSVADIWSHTSRTLTGTINANVVQIAGQTANATTAVTFPASVGTSTLDAAGVWGHTTRTLTSGAAPSVADIWSHTTRTLTSGAAPSVADIWSHTTRTLTGTVNANVVQIAGQTANATTAVTFPATLGTSTLDAAGVWSHTTRTLTSGAAPSVADIWSHTSRTLTGNVNANVVQIAGQTANATTAVTFPSSVGTSTLDASGVWSHTTRTLTSGAAPSVADIWSHPSRTLTGNVNANVVQIAGQTANATTAVTFPASIGTSMLDAAGVWNHTTRTITGGNLSTAFPTVVDIASAVWDRNLTSHTSTHTAGAYLQQVRSANDLADVFLRRSFAAVETSGVGDPLSLPSVYGVSMMALRASSSGGVLTVRRLDNTTLLGTLTLQTTTNAEGVTGVGP
jgi:hypothetical protein